DPNPIVAQGAQESFEGIRWIRRLAEREPIKESKMGNMVTANYDLSLPDLAMSNGLTSVFLSALVLSGAPIPQSDWDISVLVWLAEHDQGVVGSGVVGFDVGELAWSRDGFAEEEAFLLRVIDGALARTGWEKLSYTPKEDWLLPSLTAFREMIASYPSEY